MAIVIRIVSADGKNTIMKALPGVPARIKVPAGARVEIIDQETKQVESLAQYVNRHAKDKGKDGNPNANKVSIETVSDWAAAESWLDSVAQSPPSDTSNGEWFSSGEEEGDGKIVGLEKNTLWIGALVGVGGAAAASALSGGNSGPKDDVPPGAPRTLDLATADDNGPSTTDNITTLKSGLTITGASEAGSKVELFDGTTSLGTVTTDSAGAFTIDVSLAEGVHSITAKATDKAGNVSTESTALSITVDATAPAAPTAVDLATADDSGTSTTDNITNKLTAITITGTAEAGTTVELFDGTTSLGTATVAANGTFTRDVSLAVGVHTITVKATDGVGQTSAASEALTITVDSTSPPSPTGLDLATADDTGSSNSDNNTSKTTELTITGTADAGSIVELLDGTTSLGTVTAAANGTFSKDIGLASGSHSITARATDAAGNVGAPSEALTVVVDTAAPPPPSALDLAAEDDDGSSNTDNITSKTSGLTIAGSAEAGSVVELFDGTTSLGTVIAGVNGGFSKDISLAVGTHSITAKATDAAGNFGTSSAILEISIVASPLSESLTADTLDTMTNTTDLDQLRLFDSSSNFG